MKRFSIENVNAFAREFANSRYAELWYALGAVLQHALLDTFIMEQIRWAHSGDSTQTYTPTEIIEFRDALKAKLAEGVRRNNRAMKGAYKIDE